MLKVGLTGGIGSGKSTVAQVFSLLGVPVYYADIRAQDLLSTDAGLRASVVDLLGVNSYASDGTLNRKFVASQIFGNAELLQLFNGIVHPAVRQDFSGWCLAHQSSPYVIQEAAILIESGGADLMDALILVWAPEQVRIQRVVDRDGSSVQAVSARIQHQLADDVKVRKSHYVVINDGQHAILTQVMDIHSAIAHRFRQS